MNFYNIIRIKTVESPNITLLQSENDLYESEFQPNSPGNCEFFGPYILKIFWA